MTNDFNLLIADQADDTIREMYERIKHLESLEFGVSISTANVSNPPTAAELNNTFGNAANIRSGFIGIIDDDNLGTTVWLCVTIGGAWWYESLTKAV